MEVCARRFFEAKMGFLGDDRQERGGHQRHIRDESCRELSRRAGRPPREILKSAGPWLAFPQGPDFGNPLPSLRAPP